MEGTQLGVVAAGAAALVTAAVHLFAGGLRFLDAVPRSRWLSAGSGVSIAYVFLHLLPELERHREVFEQTPRILELLQFPVYFTAMVGLIVFYGLENAVNRARVSGEHERGQLSAIFWLHIGVFALYNGLLGYLLLHREESGLLSLIFYAIAIGLHFLVNDYALRQEHREAYHQIGRWVLAGSILVGWFIGTQVAISETIIAVLFSLLAGGILLNVLKEELPKERESRFGIFALSALLYTLALYAVL